MYDSIYLYLVFVKKTVCYNVIVTHLARQQYRRSFIIVRSIKVYSSFFFIQPPKVVPNGAMTQSIPPTMFPRVTGRRFPVRN